MHVSTPVMEHTSVPILTAIERATTFSRAPITAMLLLLLHICMHAWFRTFLKCRVIFTVRKSH
jgi:hypothetical protein